MNTAEAAAAAGGSADEAAAEKREELAALDRDAGEIRAAYSAWDERDGEAKIQEVARVWRPAVEGIIDANLGADLRDAARSLAVPTLVICGDPAAAAGPSPSPTATPWRPRIRTCASCGSPGPATTRTATTRKPSGGPSSAGSQFRASFPARNCLQGTLQGLPQCLPLCGGQQEQAAPPLSSPNSSTNTSGENR